MKFGNGEEPGLDATDVAILQTLQQDCKSPLARIGEHVGLSAPSVSERIEKLERTDLPVLEEIPHRTCGKTDEVHRHSGVICNSTAAGRS